MHLRYLRFLFRSPRLRLLTVALLPENWRQYAHCRQSTVANRRGSNAQAIPPPLGAIPQTVVVLRWEPPKQRCWNDFLFLTTNSTRRAASTRNQFRNFTTGQTVLTLWQWRIREAKIMLQIITHWPSKSGPWQTRRPLRFNLNRVGWLTLYRWVSLGKMARY